MQSQGMPRMEKFVGLQAVGFATPTPAMKFCTKCGAQLPDNAHFCTSCGETQQAAAAAAPQSSAPVASTATPPVSPPTSSAPTKKRMSGCALAAIITGGLVVLGLVFVTGLWLLVSSMTADVVKATEDYLAVLKRGQTREAYEMAASGLRKETSLAQFNKVMAQFPILTQHTKFKITSRNMQNDMGAVSGELSDDAGNRAEVEFALVKEGGVWRVLMLHVKAIACHWPETSPEQRLMAMSALIHAIRPT